MSKPKPKSRPVPSWLTTQQAGALMDKSPSTVRNWIKRKRIPREHLMQVGCWTYVSRAWATGAP